MKQQTYSSTSLSRDFINGLRHRRATCTPFLLLYLLCPGRKAEKNGDCNTAILHEKYPQRVHRAVSNHSAEVYGFSFRCIGPSCPPVPCGPGRSSSGPDRAHVTVMDSFLSSLVAVAASPQAGEAARSTGQAGLALVNKGKEVNERYHVGEKVRATF